MKKVSPAERALYSSRAKGRSLSTTRALSVHVPDEHVPLSLSGSSVVPLQRCAGSGPRRPHAALQAEGGRRPHVAGGRLARRVWQKGDPPPPPSLSQISPAICFVQMKEPLV